MHDQARSIAVKVHYLVPHRYNVVRELLPGVLTSIDFRQGPELGVRTEDEFDTGAGPLEFARCVITTLEHVFVFRGCPPRRAHVEQIHEEVIGERLWPVGSTWWQLNSSAGQEEIPKRKS
jgi:hypothetical protein